jgi:adenine phosphoribosyltransferase
MSDELRLVRRQVQRHFRWIDGDADIWALFRDAEALDAIVRGLAALLSEDQIDLVVGIEARGFALAPAVAVALGVGFSPVRKEGTLFAGDVVSGRTAPDYRGNTRSLSVRRDHFTEGQRVALVDDWIETGSQVRAAAELIDRSGGRLVAVAVIIDEAADDARANLPPIRAIVRAADLP